MVENWHAGCNGPGSIWRKTETPITHKYNFQIIIIPINFKFIIYITYYLDRFLLYTYTVTENYKYPTRKWLVLYWIVLFIHFLQAQEITIGEHGDGFRVQPQTNTVYCICRTQNSRELRRVDCHSHDEDCWY